MINKVILIGRVGADAEIRRTDSGTPVAKISLATSEKFTDKNGEKKETTEWHNVVAWKKLAEIAEKWITKGMMIYVEGKIQYKSYEKDGVKKYTTEILAYDIKFLSKPETQEQKRASEAPAQSNEPVRYESDMNLEPPADDDMPF